LSKTNQEELIEYSKSGIPVSASTKLHTTSSTKMSQNQKTPIDQNRVMVESKMSTRDHSKCMSKHPSQEI